MSEQLRHTMLNFEATPPPDAWHAISERLEDDKHYAPVHNKLRDHEATVPQGGWQAIAARLNDDLQYKQVAAKMQQAAIAPPAVGWNDIAATPNSEAPAVKKLSKHRSSLYRMAAAAIVVGLVLGAWLFINTKNGINGLSTNISGAITSATAGKPAAPPSNGDPSTQTVSAGSTSPERLRDNTKTPGYNAEGHTRSLKYAVINGIFEPRETAIVIASPPLLDANGSIIRDMDVLTTSSNYLSIMGPNGETTRISSKFASVIRYLDGSNDANEPVEYLDNVIRESDTWKKRFQEWRSKISQSSFIPSATNFLDILEFKELIQENK